MPVFPDRDRQLNEFKVKPQGADLIQRWLLALQRISSNPYIQSEGPTNLPLGALKLDDPTLSIISTEVNYSFDNYYKYETILLGSQSHTGLSHAEGMREFLIGGSLGARQRRSRDGGGYDSLPSIEELYPHLNRRMDKIGYSSGFPAPDRLDIYQQSEPTEEDENRQIYLERIMHPYYGAAYKLIKTDMFSKDLQLFEGQHQEYASLLEEVTHAIYQSRNRKSPAEEYQLVPPPKAREEIAKLEKLLEGAKQQLNAAGIIDDELDEEIESKIVYKDRPEDTFEDVGGCKEAKEELDLLSLSLVHPELFKDEGTYPPRRILMYGPPGTGKTLLARALANSAEAGLMVVEVADIVHSLYGRSERYIQKVFEVARRKSPVILFFDELDALAVHRQYADSITSRIINVMLSNLDGMRGQEDGLMVVGTTNRLDAIDRALLRPGRFDSLIEVPLPNDLARKEIFGIHMNKAVERSEGKQLFDPSLDIDTLVAQTSGFSGDDIREVVKRVLNERVRRKVLTKAVSLPPSSLDEFEAQIKRYEPVRIEKQNRSMDMKALSKWNTGNNSSGSH